MKAGFPFDIHYSYLHKLSRYKTISSKTPYEDMNFSNETIPSSEIGVSIKIWVGCQSPILIIFGAYFHFGITFYEYNSGDSQKRGIANRLS